MTRGISALLVTFVLAACSSGAGGSDDADAPQEVEAVLAELLEQSEDLASCNRDGDTEGCIAASDAAAERSRRAANHIESIAGESFDCQDPGFRAIPAALRELADALDDRVAALRSTPPDGALFGSSNDVVERMVGIIEDERANLRCA